MEEKIIYPTPANAEGWFTEDEGDASLDIFTKEYENGNLVKKFTLKKGKHKGKDVIIRELMGRDMEEIQKVLKGDKEGERENKYMQYAMFKSSNLGELGIVAEDIPSMHASDYNKLSIANASLNFM
jgi:hypothetical protein